MFVWQYIVAVGLPFLKPLYVVEMLCRLMFFDVEALQKLFGLTLAFLELASAASPSRASTSPQFVNFHHGFTSTSTSLKCTNSIFWYVNTTWLLMRGLLPKHQLPLLHCFNDLQTFFPKTSASPSTMSLPLQLELLQYTQLLQIHALIEHIAKATFLPHP